MRKSKILLLCVILFLCALTIGHASPVSTPPLKIHYIDVGQDECILIRTPNHHTLLIDAGKGKDANRIFAYLQNQKIRQIDILIATHHHKDYFGNMAAVINRFKVGQLYMPTVNGQNALSINGIKAAKANNLPVSFVEGGRFLNIDPSLVIELMAPYRRKYCNPNDGSTVVKIVYNKNSFLFTGGASKVWQKEMLKAKYDLKADVFEVGAQTITWRFLQAVSPKFAIMSVGAAHDYDRPEQYMSELFANAGATVYRTDMNGTIIISSNGEKISITTEK